MNCKNCDNPLTIGTNYCHYCGAKVIRNRLTFKNLWLDFSDRILNVDNTLLKTFIHLFTQPETVVGGYVNGVRKRYMNPISYLAVALTLSGFLIIVLQKTFPDGIDFDIFNTGMYSAELSRKMTDFTFAFYSLIFLMYLPILAVAGRLAFQEKKYLLTEYFVIFIYSQAQFSIVSNILTILLVLIVPDFYLLSSFVFLALMLAYSLFIPYRLFRFTKGKFLTNAFLFILLFGVGFVVLALLQWILMFATGAVSFEDFVPKK